MCCKRSTICPIAIVVLFGIDPHTISLPHSTVAACLSSPHQHDNVVVGLKASYTLSEYDEADSSLLAAIWLSIVCLCFELFSIFAGFSLFLPFCHGVSILAHFVATILCSWFLMEEWHYTNMWYIWVFTAMFPALLEVGACLRLFCCKVEKY